MTKATFKLKKEHSTKHFKGSIADTEALIEALDNEILAGQNEKSRGGRK